MESHFARNWPEYISAIWKILFVMRPHAEDLDDPLLLQDLVDQPVLDIDPSRISTAQIAYQLLKRRRRLQRIFSQQIEEFLYPGTQTRSGDFPGILLRLASVDQFPTHQSSSPAHSSTGVFIPSMMDSRIPGMESRWSVS